MTEQTNTEGKNKTADAVEILIADHKALKELFDQFKELHHKDADTSATTSLANQICDELTIHVMIEEEIFYPALRNALNADAKDLIDEAIVEHSTAKDLIGQIENMTPGDDMYYAKVHVLGEYTEHHVEEEQKDIFPEARKSGMDLVKIGAKMQYRKTALLAERRMEAALTS